MNDEGIEIISYTADSNTYFKTSPGDEVRALAGTVVGEEDEVQTLKQKKIARAVMIVAGGLIIISILLVGITLAMSHRIDEMGM